jgi:mRNA interferase RelE/StbE
VRVEVKDQVRDFLRHLAPDPRRKLLAALRLLEQEQGDIKPLESPLDGFYRLRVGRFRVVFRYRPGPRVQCVYVNERPIVYEVLSQRLAEYLSA